MKRFALITALLAALAFSSPVLKSSTPDSQDKIKEKIALKLCEYLLSIDYLEIPEAMKECDFMISSVSDSVTRTYVARTAYKHFRESPVMGSESVAIHIFDRWFASQNLLFEEIDEFEEARFHAYVNRQSLIGCLAKEVTLENTTGKSVTLPKKGRPSIIYFYSADCPKCLKYSKELVQFLSDGKTRANVYLVYTGDDPAQWRQYILEHLNVKKSCRTKVYHLWADPYADSDKDFVLKYGVVQAPRLFLADKNTMIIGRSLDIPALRALLAQD